MSPSEGADWFQASFKHGPSIMGILNVTPDSFYDGGAIANVADAIALAAKMVDEGASIIDVGGESTRPGHQRVGAQEEIDRVLPVVEAIAQELDTPISIDTTKAEVAKVALQSGAHVVNDVWGLQGDVDMASVAAAFDAGVIVTHNRTEVSDSLDIVADAREFFVRSLDLAAAAGVSSTRVILDPGVGFAKTAEQNLTVLGAIPRFMEFDLPILVGVSHKSFIGKTIGNVKADRLPGTIAANLRAIDGGARIIRVHDVAAHAQALKIWNETFRVRPQRLI